MEYKALARSLSILLALVAFCMVFCLGAGVLLSEGAVALKSFGPPILTGIVLLSIVILSGGDSVSLSPRTGYLFVTLAWVFSASLGAAPYLLSGSMSRLSDALFESMSGFTTTGATILSDIEALPRCILLWRATTHWLGGMGIVVLTVAIFPLLGINGRALMEAESPGPQVDKFTPRLSQTASILWLIYIGLTVILVVLLLFGGMDIVDAVCHAFAAMATGGFSTKNASVAAFGSVYIDCVLTVFMVLAGINFSQYWKLLRGDFRPVFSDSETRTYLLIFSCSSVLIAFNLRGQGLYASFGEALRFSSFQAASLLTTTGSATADYLLWPSFSQAILFLLMFVGGCAGSTAGGIKVSRILTLFRMGLAEMKYLLNPRGIYGIFVNRTYMKKTIVYDIAAMVYLYIASILVSTLVVSAGGYDILTSLSATLATLGNIGPGFNLVGPVCNYGFFPDWLKLWFFFVMMLGRLEIYTVLVLFTRSFWKR